MELHRIGKRADWLKRPKREYSWFQKVARSTNGFVAPGNVITVIGFLVTLYGLWLITEHEYGASILVLLVGRLCDIADGWVAHHTGTKSPVGELLDASCDKIATAFGVVALGASGIASWWVLAVVALPQVLTTFISTLALYRNQRLHPSPVGKISMALAWFGLGGLLMAAWLDSRLADVTFITLGYVCIAAAVVTSWYAFVRYWQQFLKSSLS